MTEITFKQHKFLKKISVSVIVCVYWCFTSHATIFQLYMRQHRCAGGLKKKMYLRLGSQHHRHFVGFLVHLSRRLKCTIVITRCPSSVCPLLTFHIFDFSSETAEQNSTKLDRKQKLNILYQVCVFRVYRKNKMAALAYDWLRHFRLLL